MDNPPAIDNPASKPSRAARRGAGARFRGFLGVGAASPNGLQLHPTGIVALCIAGTTRRGAYEWPLFFLYSIDLQSAWILYVTSADILSGQRGNGNIMTDLLFLVLGLGTFAVFSLYARWAAGA